MISTQMTNTCVRCLSHFVKCKEVISVVTSHFFPAKLQNVKDKYKLDDEVASSIKCG